MKPTQPRKGSQPRNRHFARDALLGVAVGDALGVPVEYTIREDLEIFPVKNMRGYGTHHQPPGTWSDDSSLTFCLAESLVRGYDLKDMAQQMIRWYDQGFWTPHGNVFDVGNATKAAIERMRDRKVSPQMAGGRDQHDNGNGSLMRILPLVFHLSGEEVDQRYRMVEEVSSLTHGHFRSVFSCFIYTEVARMLLQNQAPSEAYQVAIEIAQHKLNQQEMPATEQQLFERILDGRLPQLARFQIHSSGYVLHSLEASLWSWLTTESYEEAVLTAVNLGADTDTVGAITGGLAGLTYGYEEIPLDWLKQLARKNDIIDLADRLAGRNANGGHQSDREVA